MNEKDTVAADAAAPSAEDQFNGLEALIREYGVATLIEGDDNRPRQVRRILSYVRDLIAAPSAPAATTDDFGIDGCIESLLDAKTLAEKFSARNQLDIAINREIEARAAAPTELRSAINEVADFLEESANLSIISQFTAITEAIDARKAARDAEFNTGICVALQAITAQDDGVLWAEIVRTCGDDLLYHAAHVEPDEWELAGFKKYAMSELGKRKPKRRAAAPTPIVAAKDQS